MDSLEPEMAELIRFNTVNGKHCSNLSMDQVMNKKIEQFQYRKR